MINHMIFFKEHIGEHTYATKLEPTFHASSPDGVRTLANDLDNRNTDNPVAKDVNRLRGLARTCQD